MEKDGWQIAFLSTSRHHLHPYCYYLSINKKF